MTSASIRDPVADHLITPQNAALAVIDYQPAQFSGVRSMDPGLLRKNIVSTVKTAKTFGLPIVHSTINVTSGRGKPTVPELAELLEDSPRSTEPASTHGRTSTSLRLCVSPGVASSSFVRFGPRSA